MAASPVYTLTKHLLGEEPRAWIERKRTQGRSWRMLARDLWNETDHEVDVTTQTLINWMREGYGKNGDEAA